MADFLVVPHWTQHSGQCSFSTCPLLLAWAWHCIPFWVLSRFQRSPKRSFLFDLGSYKVKIWVINKARTTNATMWSRETSIYFGRRDGIVQRPRLFSRKRPGSTGTHPTEFMLSMQVKHWNFLIEGTTFPTGYIEGRRKCDAIPLQSRMSTHRYLVTLIFSVYFTTWAAIKRSGPIRYHENVNSVQEWRYDDAFT